MLILKCNKKNNIFKRKILKKKKKHVYDYLVLDLI